MHLSRFPRLRFAHLNTPLEPMERLSKHLGGPRLWIKRDDCTGLVHRRQQDPQAGIPDGRRGGSRRGHAHHPGRDPVQPCPPDRGGGGQIRHGMPPAAGGPDRKSIAGLYPERQCAARPAAWRHGLQAPGRRRHECGDGSAGRRICGRKARSPMSFPAEAPTRSARWAMSMPRWSWWRRPTKWGLKIAHVVHATGSAGTQAGLVTGLVAMNSAIPVLGIGVRAPKAKAGAIGFRSGLPHRGPSGRARHRQARACRGQYRLCRRRAMAFPHRAWSKR